MEQVTCEMPDFNPPDEEVKSALSNAKTIAIVGLSDRAERDSNMVARYLMEHGYRIIPVNPTKDGILGQKCYPDLKSIPEKVDIVDIFRKIEAVPATVDEALEIDPDAVWLQLGLASKKAAEKVRAAGKIMVQSKCIKVEHQRVFGH